MIVPWKNSCDEPRQCIKKQRHHFANKGLYSQNYGFSSGHVHIWELDHKEGWSAEVHHTEESPLDGKEIKPVNPMGSQPWVFIGRADGEAPIFWPSDAKSQLIGKDPDAKKDWGQEERGDRV